ncbi:hypothetical protein L7F22_063510 [Adiantum nelumboides]|nr:hypothetical protein [Adiantum nelumboides]
MSDPMSEASLSSSQSLGEEEEEEGDDEEVGNAEQDEEIEYEEEDVDADEVEEDDDGESIAEMQMSSPLLHARTLAEQPERLHLYHNEDGHNLQQEKPDPHDEDEEEDDLDSDEAFMERDDFDSANELAMPPDEAVPHMAQHHVNTVPEIHSSAQEHILASNDLLLEKEVEADAGEEVDEEEDGQADWLDFLKRPPEEDDGTPEEQAAFVRELERFFAERNMEFKHPKFYQENLNCLKLWRAVVRLGGHEAVTTGKLWRQVGDTFKPPKSCTTVSWSFRIFYKKALLEYERFKFGQLYPGSGDGAVQHDGGNDPQTDALQPRSSQV